MYAPTALNFRRPETQTILAAVDCTTTTGNWTTINSTLSLADQLDLSDYTKSREHTQILRWVRTTTKTPASLNWSLSSAVDISDGAYLDACFYLRTADSWNYLTFTLYSTNGGWLTFTPTYGTGGIGPIKWTAPRIPIPVDLTHLGDHWTTGGDFDPTDVSSIQLDSSTNTTSEKMGIDHIWLVQSAAYALIAFVDDDTYRDALADIFEGYNWSMAFSLTEGASLDAEDWATYAHAETHGHVMVNHSWAHLNQGTLITDPTVLLQWEAAINDIVRMRNAMQENGLVKGSRIWVAPGGGLEEGSVPYWNFYGLFNRFMDACILVSGVNTSECYSFGGYQWDNSTVPLPNPSFGIKHFNREYGTEALFTEARLDHLVACRGLTVVMMHGLDGAGNWTTAQFNTLCDQMAAYEAVGKLKIVSITDLVYGPPNYDLSDCALTAADRAAIAALILADSNYKVPAGVALDSTVAKDASLPPNFVHLPIADVTGALSVVALANAPTGATASYTVSRTSVGAAPQVDITQYQYAAFGPVSITADVAQTGDSHAFLVYSPAAPGTVLWSLTTAGSEISVGGTGNKVITLTDTDAHTGTAGVFAHVLRNTSDDTVVCEGSLTIEERPNVPAA